MPEHEPHVGQAERGALAREGEGGSAPVADAFAGALARADNDGDFVLETHVTTLREWGRS